MRLCSETEAKGQRPALEKYNPGAGGPANDRHPEGTSSSSDYMKKTQSVLTCLVIFLFLTVWLSQAQPTVVVQGHALVRLSLSGHGNIGWEWVAGKGVTVELDCPG